MISHSDQKILSPHYGLIRPTHIFDGDDDDDNVKYDDDDNDDGEKMKKTMMMTKRYCRLTLVWTMKIILLLNK